MPTSKSTKSKTKRPAYRRQKCAQYDRAFVELDGRRCYLGTYDSEASWEQYHRLLAEWKANGQRLPVPTEDLTVVELIARYWQHVTEYYRRADGTETHEVNNMRQALRPVKDLYGSSLVAEFGPLALKAVRESMIERGWCRGNINRSVDRVRRMFRWAVEHELCSGETYHRLKAVPGLRPGRSRAAERPAVTPVSDAIIEQTLKFLSPTVAAMVRLQRCTGMRPGEVCSMRTADLDMTGDVWVYSPPQHKMAYTSRSRQVFLGRHAQAFLKPYLSRNLQAPIFSPKCADAERRQEQALKRKTPLSCGNRPGSNRRQYPSRAPGLIYTTTSYARAIRYACIRAFPPAAELTKAETKKWNKDHAWTPNQLRHAFATEIRQKFGLEAAQVLLGHAQANVTQVYAQRDESLARCIAQKNG